MKKLFLSIIILFITGNVLAQDLEKATHLYKVGDFENAALEFEAALPSLEKEYGANDTSWYAFYVTFTAVSFDNCEQFNKAEQYYIQAKNIYENISGTENPHYITVLIKLANLYFKTGHFDKALVLNNKSLINIKKNHGVNHSYYGALLNNIALIYWQIGEYYNALPLYFEARDNTERSLGKEHLQYAIVLSNIATIYKEIGQYNKALPLYAEALEIIEYSYSKKHSEYCKVLQFIANLYSLMGQFDKALAINLEALEILTSLELKNHSAYGGGLHNLGLLYERQGQYDKAITSYKEALENKEKTLGKSHSSYGVSLNGLALAYCDLEQYDKALPLFLEAVQIIKTTLGVNHPEYGACLNNLALLYLNIGQYDNALPLFIEAIDIKKNSSGNEHIHLSYSLNGLANIYWQLKDYDKVLSLMHEAFDIILTNISISFSFQSEIQKEHYLGTIIKKVDAFQSTSLMSYSFKNEFTLFSYDIELVSKGLILNSTLQMRKTIISNTNYQALNIYDNWTMYNNLIAQEYSKLISDRRKDLGELEEKANTLEGELSRISSEFNVAQTIGKIKWNDVQQNLQPNDIAIEFSSFNYYNGKEWTDSIMYMVLVLRPEDEQPHLIPLFEQKQIDSLFIATGPDQYMADMLYRGGELTGEENFIDYNQRLYELVWQPFAHLIPDGSNVYFAPSGTLHQISFAAIMCDDSTRLSDKYNLNRVSTTAKLVEEPKSYENNDIVLFGGINYDTDTDTRKTIAEEIGEYDDLASRSLPEDLDRGGSEWAFLKGTENEVIAISELAKSNNVSSTLYKGDEALEDQFKQMSNPSPRYVHVATHGFFFPDPEKNYDNMSMTMGNEQFIVFKMSDNPLNRAGLLFSGANTVWTGGERPEGLDDGILTAYEASNLNLWNTELVVLSACETGLGEIKGSEGVFGLQRAFMAAGANYIIMSLWKVPDKETSEFMTKFYEGLFAGQTIPEAFNTTREYMKNKYRNEPYKWAAFVLVR